MQTRPPPPNAKSPGTAPRYARGAVLADEWCLYVVLRSRYTRARGIKYDVMIVAVFDDACDDYPGQLLEWSEGVERDEFVGETAMPATL